MGSHGEYCFHRTIAVIHNFSQLSTSLLQLCLKVNARFKHLHISPCFVVVHVSCPWDPSSCKHLMHAIELHLLRPHNFHGIFIKYCITSIDTSCLYATQLFNDCSSSDGGLVSYLKNYQLIGLAIPDVQQPSDCLQWDLKSCTQTTAPTKARLTNSLFYRLKRNYFMDIYLETFKYVHGFETVHIA